jgi:hypothetical protein
LLLNPLSLSLWAQRMAVWRYLRAMKYFELIALQFFLLSIAGAEPFSARGGAADPSATERRHPDLRSALRERRVPLTAQPALSPIQSRRLSDEERANLRHQLRRQSQDDPFRAH